MRPRSRLTLRGWLSVAYYRLRRLFVTPAPAGDRCYMGAPIGDDVHCPRHAFDGSPWCRHHLPDRGDR
jgi:hypothetical protein